MRLIGLKVLLVGLGLIVVCSGASASISTDFVKTGTYDIGGVDYNVWEMRVTTDTDWTNSRLDLTLTSGTMYNDALGSNTEPNPAFFGIAPTLEHDTYAAVPAGYPGLASFADTPTFSDTVIGASWFDSANDGAGSWTVAQIALSNDASGSLAGLSFDSASEGVGTAFGPITIMNGQIGEVPEPATLTALGLGGLALLRRRRSRK